MMGSKTNISAIDLFCGLGGLSYGLKKAGINVKAGIDQDPNCKYVYETNNAAVFIEKDIQQIEGEVIKKKYWKHDNVRILVGCAPCQPFSSHSNKIRGKESGKGWNLLNEFTRIIAETDPQIVSMENVPNLSKKNVFEKFVKSLSKLDYFVSFQNVFCPDFGIPQKRRRLVLLASKYGEINLIDKTHTPESYLTTKYAIGHLPSVEAGQIIDRDPLHRTQRLTAINLKRIKASKPNGTWLDWPEDLLLSCHKKNSGRTYKSVYGRMSWNEPSSTITTQFYNFGTGRFGHPEQDRAITIREAALLQTFPINYIFYQNEKDISINRLGIYIGNAVPVDLGYAIGISILKHLEQNKRL